MFLDVKKAELDWLVVARYQSSCDVGALIDADLYQTCVTCPQA